MFCKNCGQPLNDGQAVCLSCGGKVGDGVSFCGNCGSPASPGAEYCLNCGFAIKTQDSNKVGNYDKIVIALIAFFLGGLGVHNFMLGETKKGILRLLTCWFGLGGILALIDFVKILIGSYEVNPDKFI